MATVYQNAQTGEITYSHRDAMEWHRAGDVVYLFREQADGTLVPGPVTAWVF